MQVAADATKKRTVASVDRTVKVGLLQQLTLNFNLIPCSMPKHHLW